MLTGTGIVLAELLSNTVNPPTIVPGRLSNFSMETGTTVMVSATVPVECRAVMVTACGEEAVLLVSGKTAETAPTGTVTEVGTVAKPFDSESDTTSPPLGAGPLR